MWTSERLKFGLPALAAVLISVAMCWAAAAPTTTNAAVATGAPESQASAPDASDLVAQVSDVGDAGIVDATAGPADPAHLGSGEPVTLVFGGDVHFEGEIRPLLENDPSSVFSPLVEELSAADLAMVNLETAVTERGEPASKEFTFRSPATAFDALRAGGVDVTTMANNHGLDYGQQGLDDSLAAAYFAGFPLIGIGHDDAQAYKPYETTIKGQRIGIIAATQVLDENLISSWSAGPGKPGLASAKNVDRLLQEVRAARPRVDTLVVFLHWGTERQTCPNEQQQVLAQQLADAGVDVIVGSHAHRVLAGGRLGNSLVDYGLGNFVFYGTAGGDKAESGVLKVTVTGRRIDDYEWKPARIQGGVARFLDGDAATDAVWDWWSRRSCTTLTQ